MAKTRSDQKNDFWFVDKRIFVYNNQIKIYYIQKESLLKVVKDRNLEKVPDPMHYLVGLIYIKNDKIKDHSENIPR